MKSFVTGGAGFIGSNLASELSKRGSIKCYDNLSSGRRENTAALCEGDLLDMERLVQKMRFCDTVFHLAANTDTRAGVIDPQIDFQNGFLATHNVLEAMRLNGLKKIVFSSTCGVYGESPSVKSEEDALNPICPYAVEKMRAEWLIKHYVERVGFQAWVFRFGNVVGGVMSNGVIRDLVLKLKYDPAELYVLGSQKPSRPFLTVSDCVGGILYGFDNSNEPYQVFNIASSGSVKIGKLVKMLLGYLELDIPVHYQDQDRGWEGSAIEVRISPKKLNDLGWVAETKATDAVKYAIREIWDFIEVRSEDLPRHEYH